MSDRKTEIARRYLLPERPFLHGMASAFDMFGVLGHSSLEKIKHRANSRLVVSDVDSLRSLWQEVGDTLLSAIDKYEQECVEDGTA
ncbi:MAG: hypothetical protein OXG85_16615 [Chloroflexi bacterium]|nr:hypothetical protein [Chloroflexota bacterium]